MYIGNNIMNDIPINIGYYYRLALRERFMAT